MSWIDHKYAALYEQFNKMNVRQFHVRNDLCLMYKIANGMCNNTQEGDTLWNTAPENTPGKTLCFELWLEFFNCKINEKLEFTSQVVRRENFLDAIQRASE